MELLKKKIWAGVAQHAVHGGGKRVLCSPFRHYSGSYLTSFLNARLFPCSLPLSQLPNRTKDQFIVALASFDAIYQSSLFSLSSLVGPSQRMILFSAMAIWFSLVGDGLYPRSKYRLCRVV
jgi:hypothetical protein